MPRGVYLRTEEINKAHSGNHPSETTRKKMRLSKLGIKCSLEQRISMKKIFFM